MGVVVHFKKKLKIKINGIPQRGLWDIISPKKKKKIFHKRRLWHNRESEKVKHI